MKQIKGLVERILRPILGAGETLLLLFRSVLQLPFLWFKRNDIIRQMYVSGFKSLSVVSVVATFTGMIFSLQTGLALKDFGQQDLIGQVIVVTLTREMSPFMTALILAASVGSAIAAEIGTMTVSEEIDALEVMSIDPVRYLVMPRIVGFSLMVPVLSIYATLLGILGGGLVAQTQLGVDFSVYFQTVYDSLLTKTGLKDVWVGQLKAIVFGITISTISCRQGLAASGGAIGVGIAVRQAVVISFLFVIILGYFITAVFYR
ncbi:MAG TPA: ABC transporter permease [Leptospiraceae bacterium]|jgi:phospholipid/cholesterol/gamma-HCH transport system permease protein|nr:ABC transporter permease [Leptospirales bacterium]HMX56230.1 ABC transporter permease [Leptospiraceae bacterium]HMY43987.1 ABC transporter permease [Leptospiraceae bacterium]HMZ35160.1 ABC transporter permease [Leptospiraceae bacterium]HNJ03756.1 ABC transporter permease [Leptospiraceae bacterium]